MVAHKYASKYTCVKSLGEGYGCTMFSEVSQGGEKGEKE